MCLLCYRLMCIPLASSREQRQLTDNGRDGLKNVRRTAAGGQSFFAGATVVTQPNPDRLQPNTCANFGPTATGTLEISTQHATAFYGQVSTVPNWGDCNMLHGTGNCAYSPLLFVLYLSQVDVLLAPAYRLVQLQLKAPLFNVI